MTNLVATACWLLAALAMLAGPQQQRWLLANAESDFERDILEISQSSGGGHELPLFTEDKVNYDLHTDIFYYQDALVDEAFKRKRYRSTLATLAGQATDLTGRDVRPAVNPFAIGQRSLIGMGTSSDRWDVKDNGLNGQLFALYHNLGGGNFVVNKLRAHLLRRLANLVQDYFKILARIGEPDAREHPQQVHQIEDSLREDIEALFNEIDDSIRQSMADTDDSRAEATVAIVTASHVITAHLGNGRVLAYDDQSRVHNLTPERDPAQLNNVFGAKKSRPAQQRLYAHVEIWPRQMPTKTVLANSEAATNEVANDYDNDDDDEPANLQLLLVESSEVANRLDDYEAFKLVLNSVQQHKEDPSHEQDLYRGAVEQILDTCAKRVNVLQKFKSPDQLVALVGLETDYDNIH